MPKTRANGEGSIRHRTDGRWEVRITAGVDFATGQTKRISRYAKTQEEAVKLLHELSFMYNTAPKTFQTTTLGDWLELCLEIYMKNSLKQSTYNSYVGYIRNHLKPALGDTAIQDLSPRTLQQFYNYKYEVEGLSPKTIVNINLFLHRALSFAVSEGYIQTNPAASLNLPRGPKPQIEILNRNEQAQLIHASYRHRYGVFIRLTLFTGLRVGELLGLRWEDVDVRAGMLKICRTLNRLNKMKAPTTPGEATTEIVIQTPKSENSMRSIPLLPAILQDLVNWKNVQKNDALAAGDAYENSGFIVTNPLGGYIEPRTFKDYYNQILALAGLRQFTFHALRHTFASRAMEQGMDAKTLSVILGHYSVSFTMDTYTHVLDGHKKDEMARMEELLDLAPVCLQNYTYPIVVTPQSDGTMLFTVPDFPEVAFEGCDLAGGVEMVKEQIHEAVLLCPLPPPPTPAEQILLEHGQMLLQVPV